MSTWLHQRATTFDRLSALVTSKAEESCHLDFKADFWGEPAKRAMESSKDSEARKKARARAGQAPVEAATDVAAFANGLGGDLVLGVRDKNDRANGWSTKPLILGRGQTLRQWLQSRLVPQEVASTIEVTEMPEIDGTGDHHAVVVSAPPWPHGVVAVRCDDDRYKFPIRRGKENHYMDYNDVLLAQDPHRRRIHLGLLGLGGGGVAVRIASGMYFRSNGQEFSYRGGRDLDGRVKSLEPSRMVIEIYGSTQRAWETVTTSSHVIGSREVAEREHEEPYEVKLPNSEVAIPLGVVTEAWEISTDLAGLILNVDLVRTGDRWSLRPR